MIHTFSSLMSEVAPVFEMVGETFLGLPWPVQMVVLLTFGLFLFFGTARIFL